MCRQIYPLYAYSKSGVSLYKFCTAQLERGYNVFSTISMDASVTVRRIYECSVLFSVVRAGF